MKVLIDAEPLQKALAQVQGPIESKSTVLVRENVLLNAASDGLHLTGSNGDLEVSTRVHAEIAQLGAVTAPARELHEIARRAPKGSQVSLSLDAGDPKLKIKFGRSSLTLPTLPAHDFSNMEPMRPAACYTLLRSEFLRLIGKTEPSISTDATNYFLTGAYLHSVNEDGEDFLRMVSTNRYKLAMVEMIAPDGAAQAPGLIVPKKTIGLVRQLITEGGQGDNVDVYIEATRFGIRYGETRLISSVVDGSFPNYMRAIPQGDGHTVAKMEPPDARSAAGVALIVNKDKVPTLKINFTPGLGATVSARNTEGGHAESVIPTEVEGQSLEVGVNAKYFDETAALIEGDMTLHMWGRDDPIRVHDRADGWVTYIIMPLRGAQ